MANDSIHSEPEEFPDHMPIGEARDKMRERVKGEGCRCPVCDQFAKIYRWNLYSTAVRALILFYRLGGTTKFTHSRELKKHGHTGQGDASRLHHWGLVEEEQERRPDGGRSGFWRVTSMGEAFALNQATIPKYVHVYDSRVLGFSGEPVNVVDCLGTKFNYRELMDRRLPPEDAPE